MRLFGSRAVFADVSFAFMPFILAQNDLRRPASFFVFGFGAGALRFPPVARLYEARPFAFSPPFLSLPSARCQAGVLYLAMTLVQCLLDDLLYVVNLPRLQTFGKHFPQPSDLLAEFLFSRHKQSSLSRRPRSATCRWTLRPARIFCIHLRSYC